MPTALLSIYTSIYGIYIYYIYLLIIYICIYGTPPFDTHPKCVLYRKLQCFIDITMEEFMKLLHRTFFGDKPADIMAVLKRTVVFVFGLSALYVRL